MSVELLGPLIPLFIIGGLFAFLSYMGHRQERLDRLNGIQPHSSEPVLDADALTEPLIEDAIAQGNKIVAIKYYRELTGVGLKEAKDAIEACIANPELFIEKKKKPLMDAQDAGLRDLIAGGEIEQAAEVYRQFAGVDEYTARAAVEQLHDDLTKRS